MVKSIAEIITEVSNQKKKEDKIRILKQNDCKALRNVLVLTYDKSKEFYVPNVRPPYRASEFHDAHGVLRQESSQRQLRYIVKGFSSPDIHQIKREQIFIQLLETVDKGDAEVLCQMIEKKPFKGITAALINEAYGDLIQNG